jgi:fatty acid desaturase
MLVAGFVFHISFLGYFIYSHLWLAIASWVLIFFSFFPLFNGIRQLLEHRSDINSDYLNPASTENTKLSRLFNNSIIAKTFGSAGFNRHLLHHLEPQISYTNLGQLEEFLLHTELADEILQTETTYRKAFIKLIGS